MSNSLTGSVLLEHHLGNWFLQIDQKLDEISVQNKVIFIPLNFNVYYKIAFTPRAVKDSKRLPVKTCATNLNRILWLLLYDSLTV